MDEHWHTYWKNPGDSGLPTKIRWTLPEGWTAGPIQWPHPEAQRVGPLMNYGYSDEVMLLVELTPPADALPGPVTLKADADWLVCKDICIPEKAALTLAYAVAEGEPAAVAGNASLFGSARARLPWCLPGGPRNPSLRQYAHASRGSARRLRRAGKVAYFPHRENFIDHPAPQALVRDGNGFRLDVKLPSRAHGRDQRSGVFVAETSWQGFPGRKAVELPMSVVAALPAIAVPVGVPSGNGRQLALALVFALAGGLLLNLMPCVFPVLGIKVLGSCAMPMAMRARCGCRARSSRPGSLSPSSSSRAAPRPSRRRTQLGWGFQLQSPAFVTLLAALFFLMAMNLFGVFEWGGFAQSMTSNVSAKAGTPMPSSRACWPRWSRPPARRRSWARRSASRSRNRPRCRSRCSRCWARGWRFPCCCFPSSRDAQETSEAGPVDGDLQAGDGLPALRHCHLARVGAGSAARQRRVLALLAGCW